MVFVHFLVHINKTNSDERREHTNIESNVESSEIDCQNEMLVVTSTSENIFIYKKIS